METCHVLFEWPLKIFFRLESNYARTGFIALHSSLEVLPYPIFSIEDRKLMYLQVVFAYLQGKHQILKKNVFFESLIHRAQSFQSSITIFWSKFFEVNKNLFSLFSLSLFSHWITHTHTHTRTQREIEFNFKRSWNPKADVISW